MLIKARGRAVPAKVKRVDGNRTKRLTVPRARRLRLRNTGCEDESDYGRRKVHARCAHRCPPFDVARICGGMTRQQIDITVPVLDQAIRIANAAARAADEVTRAGATRRPSLREAP